MTGQRVVQMKPWQGFGVVAMQIRCVGCRIVERGCVKMQFAGPAGAFKAELRAAGGAKAACGDI